MNSDYTLSCIGGVNVLSSRPLLEAGCIHGFTLRNGSAGASIPPFDAFNFGLNRAEPIENVMSNYRALCNSFSLDYESLTLVSYEHGSNVLEITSAERGRGISREPLPPCDGLVSIAPDVTLVTLHADCACYYVFDPISGAVGIAHAGWKGIFGRIGAKLTERLVTLYGADIKNIRAAVSPCICEKCFEVGADLAERFVTEFGTRDLRLPHADPSHAYLDLRLASQIQFLDAGVLPEHIYHIPCCTFERADVLYSYRRDGKRAGAMAGFIRATRT